MKRISAATQSVKVAMYYFTNKELFDLLCLKLTENCRVELVIHNNFISVASMRLDFQRFINLGGHLYMSDENQPMHHKFCILDSATVITGSYNWTYFAEMKNCENILIVEQFETATSDYCQEFERLKQIYPRIVNVNSLKFLSATTERHRIEYLVQDVFSEVFETGNSSVLQEITFIEDPQKASQSIQLNEAYLKNSIFTDTKSGYALLLEEGSTIPASSSKKFYTAYDKQTSIRVQLFWGKQGFPEQKAKMYLETTIHNLPLKDAGLVEVTISSQILSNGELIVAVTSTDTKQIVYARKNIRSWLKVKNCS